MPNHRKVCTHGISPKGDCLDCTRHTQREASRNWKKNNPDKVKAENERRLPKKREASRSYMKRKRAELKRRDPSGWKELCRADNLWRKFRITAGEYGKRLESQDGVCAICGKPPTKKHLAVDHNHVTGKIRGLLCASCNRGVGCLQDNPSILRAAAEYLENR